MWNILIGVIIILVVFIIRNFFYVEKNTCVQNESKMK